MKFVARAPREGVNISQTHPLREALVLVTGIAAVLVAVTLLLAFLVDIGVPFIPPETEVEVFDNWGPALADLGEGESVRQQALQSLLDDLAVLWADNPYRLRIGITDSEEVNAFALPGGFIVVTSGLLAQVESENELAFVLGHEIGHFANRDHLRRLGRGAIAGLLWVTIVGSTGAASDSQLLQVIQRVTSSALDRDNESDADAFGLGLLGEQYGHAAGALDFFGRLNAEATGDGDVLSAYVSSHPSDQRRRQTLAEVAAEQNLPLEGEMRPWAGASAD